MGSGRLMWMLVIMKWFLYDVFFIIRFMVVCMLEWVLLVVIS